MFVVKEQHGRSGREKRHPHRERLLGSAAAEAQSIMGICKNRHHGFPDCPSLLSSPAPSESYLEILFEWKIFPRSFRQWSSKKDQMVNMVIGQARLVKAETHNVTQLSSARQFGVLFVEKVKMLDLANLVLLFRKGAICACCHWVSCQCLKMRKRSEERKQRKHATRKIKIPAPQEMQTQERHFAMQTKNTHPSFIVVDARYVLKHVLKSRLLLLSRL